MWRMSRKPRVVIIPTRAPSCWSRELVAMVVPWARKSTSRASGPVAASPSTRPWEGSSGVLGTLWMRTCRDAVSTTMTSVKVPPTSTPASFIDQTSASRPLPSAGRPLVDGRQGARAADQLLRLRPLEGRHPGGGDAVVVEGLGQLHAARHSVQHRDAQLGLHPLVQRSEAGAAEQDRLGAVLGDGPAGLLHHELSGPFHVGLDLEDAQGRAADGGAPHLHAVAPDHLLQEGLDP